ncbi:MAG: hypothetical protein AVDCRST_MAG01-01-1592, partial [uncultured Rubrobacteraceae bacterium]
ECPETSLRRRQGSAAAASQDLFGFRAGGDTGKRQGDKWGPVGRKTSRSSGLGKEELWL